MLNCAIRMPFKMFGRLWLGPPWPNWGFSLALIVYKLNVIHCPASQDRVTALLCFVYKGIRDLEYINHLCINPFRRIGLIHM